MKKSVLKEAVSAALGISVLTAASSVHAVVTTYDWDGILTTLDPGGAAVANTSITAKGANQYQTPVSGTMAFNTVTGAGTATLVPFDFLKSSAPAAAISFNMQTIGDGAGGAGTLVLGNMLINWKGNYGIPVSIVLDAAGLFGATSGMWSDGTLDQADVAGHGAVPASDGTYINSTWGYLGVGPVPMATTEWNLTRATACGTLAGTCMAVSPSGILPLVSDTAINNNEYAQGDGFGVGGVPMWDGPLTGFNFNFDILSMTITNSAVPVPAAVWLFGSGLLGLSGVARRKKAA